MHIVSALFIDTFEMKQAPGPATRIDLTGVFFSLAAPSPVPVTIEPHLMALIYCQGQSQDLEYLKLFFGMVLMRIQNSWLATSALSRSNQANLPIDLSEVPSN